MSLFSTALSVAAKELRTSLRDRQTLIYAVLLPLALYPAIFWIMLQGYAFLQGRDGATTVRVGVAGEARRVEWPRIARALEDERDGRHPGPIEIETLVGSWDAKRARGRIRSEEQELDALLLFAGEGQPTQLFHDSTRSDSTLARRRVSERLGDLAQRIREQEVDAMGRPWDELSPYAVEERDVGSQEGLGGYLLSFLLPMMFVFMGILGAFYPAVDATAGEKERHTAETTLLLPVPRTGIYLGKVLAIATASFVATGLNLGGMALAAEHLLASMPGADAVAIEIPWGAFLRVLPLGLVFLFSMSAVLFAVSSLADTFKQGQSLLGTVQMLFLFPAMVGVLPGIELNAGLALLPVVQTVLAFKAILQTSASESANLLHLALAFVSQLLYAALAIYLALRLTSRESLQTGQARGRRWLSLMRTTRTPD